MELGPVLAKMEINGFFQGQHLGDVPHIVNNEQVKIVC